MNAKKIIFILCFAFALVEMNAQSMTFNYTGSQQTWTVPNCVNQITVTVAGAQGGEGQGAYMSNSAYDAGGMGGSVTGVLSVVGGSTLYIFVGGQGTAGTSSSEGIGGWNGGANGYYDYIVSYNQGGGGGGGGGASDLRIGGNALANRKVVAGGGGGAGFNTFIDNYEQGGAGGASAGGAGYANGSPGYGGYPGNGGTQAAGGSGGTYPGTCTANSGTLGNGGADCISSPNAGGGGGGGYYGGGGGVWAGGGGGSNYAGGLLITNSNSQGTQSGDGTITINWSASSSLIVTANVVANVTCHGGNNGSASSVVSGGTSPYTYSWAPSGGTNSNATGLIAGTYTINVTDKCGNTGTASVTITQPVGLSLSASVITNVLCNGGNGGAAWVIVNGGASPFTYSWTPSGGTGSTASGLTAGTYTVTVKDACGGSSSASVSITQPNTLSDSINITANVNCNGGSNGSASAIINGGTSPYTYSWNNGGTNSIVTGLSAGTYSLTVKDNNGCTSSASATITQPAILSIAATAVANVSCNGGNNGIASAQLTGGGSPFVYSWTPSGATTDSASGLSIGTYIVTVRDGCGASATASVTITQPNILTGASFVATANVSCLGGSNGIATAQLNGGGSPFTYTWTPSGETINPATGLSAGSYTVMVHDACGSSATASGSITQPNSVLSVTASTTVNVNCNGNNNGSASCMVGGGSTPYTYAWTPSGGTNANATGLTAGTYTITVTDASGCTVSATVSITQPTPINIVSHSKPDNGSGNGAAWVSLSGGNSPYTYSWSPGGNTTDSISSKKAGVYCCTVKDAHGCTDSACITIESLTGIDNLRANSETITIYPNPNKGQFIIESSLASGRSSEVEIYNILGEKVCSQFSTFNSPLSINLGNEPDGIYLYRVVSESGNLLGEGKIIVQK